MLSVFKILTKYSQLPLLRTASFYNHDIESASEYHQLSTKHANSTKVLLFYSSYGKPSLNLKKKVESMATQHKKSLITVDVEAAPEVCEEFHVESVPTMFAIKGIDILSTFVGMPNDDKINDILKSI